jgi:hypothetical protein
MRKLCTAMMQRNYECLLATLHNHQSSSLVVTHCVALAIFASLQRHTVVVIFCVMIRRICV